MIISKVSSQTINENFLFNVKNQITQKRETEEEFIISWLACELQDKQAEIPVPANLNWEKAALFLEENRLAAHFYTSFRHLVLLPKNIRERLRQTRYTTLLYGDKCRIEVEEVLNAFSKAGIPVIVLKGWAVIQWLYNGDHGQRFCEDIDLLIPPDRIDLAEETLQRLAYCGADEVQAGYFRKFKNARAYSRAEANKGIFRKFFIGLHWGLTNYPYYDKNQVNIFNLFKSARPLFVAGVPTLELSYEDQLIYTCAHLALHHRNVENLLNYYEIAAIIKRAGAELDWQIVIERSKQWRYLVQVKHVLEKVNELWPFLIPTRDFEKVNQAQAEHRDQIIDKLVEKTKGNIFKSALVEFLTMPGWKNKFESTFQQIFPDKAYITARYGKNHALKIIVIYIQRLFKAIQGIFSQEM